MLWDTGSDLCFGRLAVIRMGEVAAICMHLSATAPLKQWAPKSHSLLVMSMKVRRGPAILSPRRHPLIRCIMLARIMPGPRSDWSGWDAGWSGSDLSQSGRPQAAPGLLDESSLLLHLLYTS